ncbi:MAG: 4Fe-4S binding protein [Deltaproteobacteria bacterium]|nr:MAG: 4Fe-4S binding protein [Deltaproteobacteria bacterium]
MIRVILFLRRTVQALSFCFLVYLILHTAFPLDLKIPVDLYLRLDPFIGIISLFTQKEVIWRMWPAFGLLLLILAFGNFFCGWLCPMGAAIDFFDRILFRERKRSKPLDDQPLRRLRYGVFIFALTAGLMAFQVMYLLDPISLITRSLVIALYPPAIYVYNYFLTPVQNLLPGDSALLSSIPLPLFKVNLFIFLFFILILALGVIRKRFWCRYLCPLGTLFSICSRFRMFRRFASDECTHCQKCVRACPVGAIPEEAPEQHRQQDCISCFKCLECPPRAVSFRLASPQWKTVEGVHLSRRYVLGSFAFGLTSSLVIKTNPLQSESGQVNDRLIRPPGSLPEEQFVSVCTGCGECLKVCPNNALQSTFLEAGLAGLYTPRLVPRIGYCEEFCNFCGRVCPTEAIRPITIEEKRLIQVGVAHINKTRCIAWDTDKVCLVCNEQCSYQAIIGDDKKRPSVKEEKCTGCGICENKCPVDGESAIIVHSSGVQKKLKPEPSNGQ